MRSIFITYLFAAVASVATIAPARGGDGMPGVPYEECMYDAGCRIERGLHAAPYYVPRGHAGPSFWHHNGSIMALRSDGHFREFYYEAPRPGMLAAGARPGALLFSGRAQGNRYEGVAYIFNSVCGPLGYRVTGPILEDYSRVLLHGMAPRVNRDCAIIGYRPDLLEFDFIAR